MSTSDARRWDHRHRTTAPEAADWDERYRTGGAGGRVWSGRPNPTLVDEVADLAPGRALDLGCGEGADAIWLAVRGWQVVAVDFAAAALERGAEHARAAGAHAADRVGWRRHDLRTWEPAPGAFDLVTAHFVHATSPQREEMLARWAAGVAPGGTLLVVAHSPLDLEQTLVRRPPDPALYATAQRSASRLDPAAWEVAVAEERARVVEAGGEAVTVHDAVLAARRRPPAA